MTSRVVLYADGSEAELTGRAAAVGARGFVTRTSSPRALLEQIHRLLRD
jgi:DNA-binding NarL/FixJ family response regulator